MNAKMQVEANQESGPWSENKVLAYHCERQEEVGGGVKICRKNAQGQYYWEDNTKPCVLRDYPGGSIFCVSCVALLFGTMGMFTMCNVVNFNNLLSSLNQNTFQF